MNEFFDVVWLIILQVFAWVNIFIGYLLDIKIFGGIPLLVFFVFFDLMMHLMAFFGGNDVVLVDDLGDDVDD